MEREPEGLSALEPQHLLAALRSHFAPVLLNDDDLTITYVGEALDPADEIACEGDVDPAKSPRAVVPGPLFVVDPGRLVAGLEVVRSVRSPRPDRPGAAIAYRS